MVEVQAETGEDGQSVKKRAACDECRIKKLKCTGEQPACSRCVREEITCVYSPQKQMGRPKKRQRTADEDNTRAETSRSSKDASPQHGGWDLHAGSAGGYGLGFSEWDPALIPGWNVPPWMKSGFTDTSGSIPPESAIPGLTPDSSANSPPTLNLPPELQNISFGQPHNHSHNHNLPHQTVTSPPSSTSLLLDPTLPTNSTTSLTPSAVLPNCACLSTLYLTLNTLTTLDPSTTPFPFALHPLREAMSTASSVLHCPECPTRFISAVQNTQLVGTLLVSIAERFGKVLSAITEEAHRADETGSKKRFQLADLNTSTLHLHTGGIGCAASSFSIDLTGSEWRKMSKQVVRAEVYGPSDGNACCSHLMGLLQQMEDRQALYHGPNAPMPADFPRDPVTGLRMGGSNIPKEDHVCLKLVAYSRKLVEGFDWS